MTIVKLDWSLPDRIIIKGFRRLLRCWRNEPGYEKLDASDEVYSSICSKPGELPDDLKGKYEAAVKRGRPLLTIVWHGNIPAVDLAMIVLDDERSDRYTLYCFRCLLKAYRPKADEMAY